MKKPSLSSPPAKSNITNKQLTFKQTVILALSMAVVLLSISGFYWYKYVLTDPDRILSGMLDKSLNSISIQRNLSQEEAGNTFNQTTYVAFSPEVKSKTVTEIREIDQAGDTTVTTEMQGVKDVDYVRYTDISVSGNQTNNQNFSNVLNVWAKRGQDPAAGTSPTFLNEAIFLRSLVPFGNFTERQRDFVKSEINRSGLYQIEKTKQEFINGRPVMTYRMNIDQKSLIEMLAKYSQVSGIGTNLKLDPSQYEGSQKVPVVMQVDILSRHLKKIEFGGLNTSITYGAYNSRQQLNQPDKTISIEELEGRLRALEGQQ